MRGPCHEPLSSAAQRNHNTLPVCVVLPLLFRARSYPRSVYTLTMPRALRFFAPEAVQWAEEQTLDLKGEVLAERCYTLTDGLDQSSGFVAWWSTISCAPNKHGLSTVHSP